MKITRNHSQIQKQAGDLSHKATLVKRMIAACTMCVAAMLFAMGIRATVQASNRYDVSNYKWSYNFQTYIQKIQIISRIILFAY